MATRFKVRSAFDRRVAHVHGILLGEFLGTCKLALRACGVVVLAVGLLGLATLYIRVYLSICVYTYKYTYVHYFWLGS